MKRTKLTIALILVLVLCTLVFSSCNNGNNNDFKTESSSHSVESTSKTSELNSEPVGEITTTEVDETTTKVSNTSSKNKGTTTKSSDNETTTTTIPTTNKTTNNSSSQSKPSTITTTTKPSSSSNTNLEAKNKEIQAENERHAQAVKELTEERDYLVELNEDRINTIKDTYGISYVYDDLTCVERISDLDSEISDIEYRMFRIEPYKNEPEYMREYRTLQAEKQSLENEKNQYEKMREINRYLYAIESHESNYQHNLEQENSLHKENLAAIEAKYS